MMPVIDPRAPTGMTWAVTLNTLFPAPHNLVSYNSFVPPTFTDGWIGHGLELSVGKHLPGEWALACVVELSQVRQLVIGKGWLFSLQLFHDLALEMVTDLVYRALIPLVAGVLGM